MSLLLSNVHPPVSSASTRKGLICDGEEVELVEAVLRPLVPEAWALGELTRPRPSAAYTAMLARFKACMAGWKACWNTTRSICAASPGAELKPPGLAAVSSAFCHPGGPPVPK